MLLGVDNMTMEERANYLLKRQIKYMFRNIFIDFNDCTFCGDGERESQILVSFIEKNENKYLLLEACDTSGYLNAGDIFAFKYHTIEECYEFAKKIAWNFGYALQFGKTNIVIQGDQKNLISNAKNEENQKPISESIVATLISSNDIKILKDKEYYSLKDVQSIKSELANINIDYSCLPIFLIKDFYKEFNGEFDMDPEAKIFLDDYQCLCSFINSIMDDRFDSNRFDIRGFEFPRQYIIDKDYINRLFKFIDSFQSCDKDMILYRGTENELNSNHFISTSLSKDFAYEWSKSNGYQIILPKDSLFFTSLGIKKGIWYEAEVILLPGNFDYVPDKNLYIYNGKSKEEVKQIILERMKKQKQQIIYANNQSEQSFDEALLYGESLIESFGNKKLK